MNNDYRYLGGELLLFAEASTWKRYFANKIQPFVHGEVLEVGAGLGSTSKVLNDGSAKKWLMLEPDPGMYSTLMKNSRSFPPNTSLDTGTVNDIDQTFDTILYIDVLEHIEDDTLELLNASQHLSPGGHLIILSPAFSLLYSEFDRTIGHQKRYSKKSLRKVIPGKLGLVSIQYLDSFGFFASLANKIFLHQPYPSSRQIQFWDKYLVPLSRITDPIFLHSFGKSILGIWEKQ